MAKDDRKVIKVCGDPHCCELYHNIPKSVTKCNNCDGKLMEINQTTYDKKYKDWHFQYDFETMEYYRSNTETTTL